MKYTSYIHIADGEIESMAYDDEVSGYPDSGIFTVNLFNNDIEYREFSNDESGDCQLCFRGSFGMYGWLRASDDVSAELFGRRLNDDDGKPYIIESDSHSQMISLNGAPSFSIAYYKGPISKPTESLIFLVTSAPVQWHQIQGRYKVPWPYGTDSDPALQFDPVSRTMTLDKDCISNPDFSFPGLHQHLNSVGAVHSDNKSLTFAPYDGQLFSIGRDLYLYVDGKIYERSMVGVTLEARNLTCKGYHNKTGQRMTFLSDANLVVNPGEIVAIIGESGGGKSTLLKALCGYCEASDGNVLLNGADLYSDNSLRAALGYLPQADLLNESLTVSSELSYQARLKCPNSYDSERRASRIRDLLRRFNIEDEKDNRISNLSGGQKKRVAIVAALLSEPSILFLDEPTSPLDPGMSGEFVRETLVEVSRSGCSVVFVTHDMDTLVTADRIVWVHRNHIEWDGTLVGLMEASDSKDLTELAARLFGKTDFRPKKHYEPHTLSLKDVRSDISIRNYLKPRIGKIGQLLLCVNRSAELLLSNPSNSLLVIMPIVIGLLMGIVSDESKMYNDYTFTKSMLFTFSAGAFFIGVFNSIQVFTRREHLAVEQYHGLSTTSYMFAVLLVQTVVCVIQTALLTSIFAYFSPDLKRQIISTVWDLYFTALLCCESAMCMGLAASAAVRRASNLAPVLVLLQIIFSGIIFPVEGIALKLSYLTSCKWAVTSLGALSDLNSLRWMVATEEAAAAAAQSGTDAPMYSVIHVEPMYNPEVNMFLRGWIWMVAIAFVLVALTLLILKRREHSQYRIVGPAGVVIATVKRLRTTHLKHLLLVVTIIALAVFVFTGSFFKFFDMLHELGAYLLDVADKLPEAFKSTIDDFREVFFS